MNLKSFFPGLVRDKHRMTLVFTDAVLRRLEGLRNMGEATSHLEVITRALAVYDAVLTAQAQGKEVVIRGGDGDEARLLVK